MKTLCEYINESITVEGVKLPNKLKVTPRDYAMYQQAWHNALVMLCDRRKASEFKIYLKLYKEYMSELYCELDEAFINSIMSNKNWMDELSEYVSVSRDNYEMMQHKIDEILRLSESKMGDMLMLMYMQWKKPGSICMTLFNPENNAFNKKLYELVKFVGVGESKSIYLKYYRFILKLFKQFGINI